MRHIILYSIYYAFAAMLVRVRAGGNPNPPNWDTNRVIIIEPGDSQAQQKVDAVYSYMGTSTAMWRSQRYAIMFKPGNHNVHLKVGYYTQAIGLGFKPTEVTIYGGLTGLNSEDPQSETSYNHWRSVENMQLMGNVFWATSQGTSLRRSVIQGNLVLIQDNHSSGGFMADVEVSNLVNLGANLSPERRDNSQFMSRNSQWQQWNGVSWNTVFSGCENAPTEKCDEVEHVSSTVIPSTELIAEKPFISMYKQWYILNVPYFEWNKVGRTSGWDYSKVKQIDFSEVAVVNERYTAREISWLISQGNHIVFQPGNYYLDEPIKVDGTHDNIVLLGLGMPTLISTKGLFCIQVAIQAKGVRISGFILQTQSNQPNQSLLYFGDWSQSVVPETYLSAMHDIFARLGGSYNHLINPVQADYLVEIRRAHVIIDNMWLWRADKDISGAPISLQNNPLSSGLYVFPNAENVIAYGLSAENALNQQVNWAGNYGKAFGAFLRYAPDSDRDFPAYQLQNGYLKTEQWDHQAYGVGVMAAFNSDQQVKTKAIMSPDYPEGIIFKNAFTGLASAQGSISYIWNMKGQQVNKTIPFSFYCDPLKSMTVKLYVKIEGVLQSPLVGRCTQEFVDSDEEYSFDGTQYTRRNHFTCRPWSSVSEQSIGEQLTNETLSGQFDLVNQGKVQWRTAVEPGQNSITYAFYLQHPNKEVLEQCESDMEIDRDSGGPMLTVTTSEELSFRKGNETSLNLSDSPSSSVEKNSTNSEEAILI